MFFVMSLSPTVLAVLNNSSLPAFVIFVTFCERRDSQWPVYVSGYPVCSIQGYRGSGGQVTSLLLGWCLQSWEARVWFWSWSFTALLLPFSNHRPMLFIVHNQLWPVLFSFSSCCTTTFLELHGMNNLNACSRKDLFCGSCFKQIHMHVWKGGISVAC